MIEGKKIIAAALEDWVVSGESIRTVAARQNMSMHILTRWINIYYLRTPRTSYTEDRIYQSKINEPEAEIIEENG